MRSWIASLLAVLLLACSSPVPPPPYIPPLEPQPPLVVTEDPFIPPPVFPDPADPVDPVEPPPVVDGDVASYLEGVEFRVEQSLEVVKKNEVLEKAGRPWREAPSSIPGTTAWHFKVTIRGQQFDYEVIVDSTNVVSVEGPM